MRVDEPGRHDQPGCIDFLSSQTPNRANRRDPPAGDCDISTESGGSRPVNDQPAPNHEIEIVSATYHPPSLPCGRSSRYQEDPLRSGRLLVAVGGVALGCFVGPLEVSLGE
jgi:hypothetical protein